MKRVLLLGTLVFVAHCSDAGVPPGGPDAGAQDAVAMIDRGTDSGVVAADADPMDLGFADAPAPDADPADAGFPDAIEMDAGFADADPVDAGAAPFVLTSAAFVEGGPIPDRHSCQGVDLQPELSWTGVPAGTQSFALVLIDDSIDFVHWIAYNMPPATTSLPEGASDMSMLPAGTIEADAYCVEYCGPCPGVRHTYTFRIYALSVATTNFNWPGTIRARHLAAAFDANTLEQATLTGNFTP